MVRFCDGRKPQSEDVASQEYERHKEAMNERDQEISELEAHFAEFCIDISLGKKDRPIGMRIGQYAVVGYDPEGNFKCVGFERTPAEAWKLRDATFPGKIEGWGGGHVIQVTPDYFPDIIIKRIMR